MAEHLYTTRAFILGSTSVGEANRLIDLFTESHGRLRALARGVRLEKSKLRYHLLLRTFVMVSLVRGKAQWRLVGVESERSMENLSPATLAVVGNAARLLRRLLQGEEAAPLLFTTLSDSLSFLTTSSLTTEELKNMECVIVLRILFHLGYLGREEPLASYLDRPLSRELLEAVSPIRQSAIARINDSLNASSL